MVFNAVKKIIIIKSISVNAEIAIAAGRMMLCGYFTMRWRIAIRAIITHCHIRMHINMLAMPGNSFPLRRREKSLKRERERAQEKKSCSAADTGFPLSQMWYWVILILIPSHHPSFYAPSSLVVRRRAQSFFPWWRWRSRRRFISLGRGVKNVFKGEKNAEIKLSHALAPTPRSFFLHCVSCRERRCAVKMSFSVWNHVSLLMKCRKRTSKKKVNLEWISKNILP